MAQSSIVVVASDENHNLNEVVRALDENLPQRLCTPEALTLEIHEGKKAAVWVADEREANAVCGKLIHAGLKASVLPADGNPATHEMLRTLAKTRSSYQFAAWSRKALDIVVAVTLIAIVFFGYRWVTSHHH